MTKYENLFNKKWKELRLFSIVEVALYVKGKAPITYAVLGLGYGGDIMRGVKGREGYLYRDEIYWALRLFWLNLDKCLR